MILEEPKAPQGNAVIQPESVINRLPLATLMPFDATGQLPWTIPFAFDDYLELVDWIGRAVRPSKRGHIPDYHPAILDRLGIDYIRFIEHMDRFLDDFGTAVGAPTSMVDLCAKRQTNFLRAIKVSCRIFTDQQAA